MSGGFTRGLIIGSLIGASVSLMMDPNMAHSRTRKKMMKAGRNFFRKSGGVIGDLIDIIR